MLWQQKSKFNIKTEDYFKYITLNVINLYQTNGNTLIEW